MVNMIFYHLQVMSTKPPMITYVHLVFMQPIVQSDRDMRQKRALFKRILNLVSKNSVNEMHMNNSMRIKISFFQSKDCKSIGHYVMSNSIIQTHYSLYCTKKKKCACAAMETKEKRERKNNNYIIKTVVA